MVQPRILRRALVHGAIYAAAAAVSLAPAGRGTSTRSGCPAAAVTSSGIPVIPAPAIPS